MIFKVMNPKIMNKTLKVCVIGGMLCSVAFGSYGGGFGGGRRAGPGSDCDEKEPWPVPGRDEYKLAKINEGMGLSAQEKLEALEDAPLPEIMDGTGGAYERKEDVPGYIPGSANFHIFHDRRFTGMFYDTNNFITYLPGEMQDCRNFQLKYGISDLGCQFGGYRSIIRAQHVEEYGQNCDDKKVPVMSNEEFAKGLKAYADYDKKMVELILRGETDDEVFDAVKYTYENEAMKALSALVRLHNTRTQREREALQREIQQASEMEPLDVEDVVSIKGVIDQDFASFIGMDGLVVDMKVYKNQQQFKIRTNIPVRCDRMSYTKKTAELHTVWCTRTQLLLVSKKETEFAAMADVDHDPKFLQHADEARDVKTGYKSGEEVTLTVPIHVGTKKFGRGTTITLLKCAFSRWLCQFPNGEKTWLSQFNHKMVEQFTKKGTEVTEPVDI